MKFNENNDYSFSTFNHSNDLTLSQKKEINKPKVYINTLSANFNYVNHIGEIVYPKKCCFTYN